MGRAVELGGGIAAFKGAHMMTPTALKALKGSIRKWQRIVDGSGSDKGRHNCPLCKIYYEKGCKGCPVMKATGKLECDGSPYDTDWDGGNLFNMADTDKQLVAAVKELRFLKSLLPPR